MADIESAVALAGPLIVVPYNPPSDKLPPEQSYLRRPVDPEIVARVHRSLKKFKGPKNGSERDQVIRCKADEQRKNLELASKEYLAWARKVKEDTVPCFKFPEETHKDKPSNEAYVKEKVKTALHEMRRKDKEYETWLADLNWHHDVRLQQKVQEKQCNDKAFDGNADARQQERLNRDEEFRKQALQHSTEYRQWLRDTQFRIAKRSSSAPSTRSPASASADTLAKKKQQESMVEFKQRRAEYRQWLKSVSQPKFTLPLQDVTSSKEKAKKAAALRKRAQNKVAAEYFEMMRKIEQKHHARMMRSVRDKLESDREYCAAGDAKAHARNQSCEEKQQQLRELMLKERQLLKEMHERVKTKPLFLELAYQ